MFNKPLKTRIKKVTTADGTVRHYAQFKYVFSWYDFSDMEVTVWSHTTPLVTWLRVRGGNGGSIESAMSLIDHYINDFENEESRRNNRKAVNTEYIKYP